MRGRRHAADLDARNLRRCRRPRSTRHGVLPLSNAAGVVRDKRFDKTFSSGSRAGGRGSLPQRTAYRCFRFALFSPSAVAAAANEMRLSCESFRRACPCPFSCSCFIDNSNLRKAPMPLLRLCEMFYKLFSTLPLRTFRAHAICLLLFAHTTVLLTLYIHILT